MDVDATAGTGNAIRLNSIFSNTGLGIDLGGDGVTLNNSAGHTGPNDYENFPVITAVTSAGGVTTVTGSLSSTADTTFAVDFFTLSSINASGYGEGRYVLGSTTVMTNVTGNADFVFQFPTPAGGARFTTATATDPGGNTSEFSQAFGVDIPPTAVIGFTNTRRQRRGPQSRSTAWDLSTPAAVRSPLPGRSATAGQRRGPSRRTPLRHRGSIR